MNTTDTGTFNALIEDLEPAIARGQFRAASRNLAEHFEKLLERDGAQSARSLCEKMRLITGDRRTKAMNVDVERRATVDQSTLPIMLRRQAD